MNRADLINITAERTGLSKKKTESVLTVILETISEALVDKQTVKLVGFGTFEVKDRRPRVGRNPRTNESINIAASRAPVFKPSAALKKSCR